MKGAFLTSSIKVNQDDRKQVSIIEEQDQLEQDVSHFTRQFRCFLQVWKSRDGARGVSNFFIQQALQKEK